MNEMFENVYEHRETTHHSVMRLSSNYSGMDALRYLFSDCQVDELNFVLFSTSGTHGTYATIEDAERCLKSDMENESTAITFLVVHPRIVALRYGQCTPTNQNDIDFLRSLRKASLDVVSRIGVER